MHSDSDGIMKFSFDNNPLIIHYGSTRLTLEISYKIIFQDHVGSYWIIVERSGAIHDLLYDLYMDLLKDQYRRSRSAHSLRSF